MLVEAPNVGRVRAVAAEMSSEVREPSLLEGPSGPGHSTKLLKVASFSGGADQDLMLWTSDSDSQGGPISQTLSASMPPVSF